MPGAYRGRPTREASRSFAIRPRAGRRWRLTAPTAQTARKRIEPGGARCHARHPRGATRGGGPRSDRGRARAGHPPGSRTRRRRTPDVSHALVRPRRCQRDAATSQHRADCPQPARLAATYAASCTNRTASPRPVDADPLARPDRPEPDEHRRRRLQPVLRDAGSGYGPSTLTYRTRCSHNPGAEAACPTRPPFAPTCDRYGDLQAFERTPLNRPAKLVQSMPPGSRPAAPGSQRQLALIDRGLVVLRPGADRPERCLADPLEPEHEEEASDPSRRISMERGRSSSRTRRRSRPVATAAPTPISVAPPEVAGAADCQRLTTRRRGRRNGRRRPPTSRPRSAIGLPDLGIAGPAASTRSASSPPRTSASAAAMSAPISRSSDERRDDRADPTVRVGHASSRDRETRDAARDRVAPGLPTVPRSSRHRQAQVERLRADQQLDREDALHVREHVAGVPRRRSGPSRRGPPGSRRSGSSRPMAGWTRTLFSDASAAAVYWRSIIPELRPLAGRQKRRQAPVEARVDQQRDPPLGDRAQLRDRQLREVERERDRLAVEVAAADHEAAARRRDVRGRGAAPGEDERDCPWRSSARRPGPGAGSRARRGRRRGPAARSAASTGPGPCATSRDARPSAPESRRRWRSSAATAIWPGCGRASW